MTITEFLLARIAEDEARARDFEHAHALAMNGDYGNYVAIYTAPADWAALERLGFTPSRVLAECAARRAIIDRAVYWHQRTVDTVTRGVSRDRLNEVLHALAAVYADHPDYRQEWAV